LKYKKGGEWYEIALYEEKPTENTLALRISNKAYYAGLVDPTDEVASDLRIRLNNVVYAVAYEKPAGVKEIAAKKYVKSNYAISLFGNHTTEIYAKIKATQYQVSDSKVNPYNRPILRIYKNNTSATARRDTTTLQSVHAATNVFFDVVFDSTRIMFKYFAYTTGSYYASSGGFTGPEVDKILATFNSEGTRWNSATANGEHEYLITDSPSAGTEFFYDGTRYWQNTYSQRPGEQSANVAIGDMLQDGTHATTILDFYVKVNGEQVLGLTDLS